MVSINNRIGNTNKITNRKNKLEANQIKRSSAGFSLFLNKNLNAPRPSEHPSVRGGEMSKHLGGINFVLSSNQVTRQNLTVIRESLFTDRFCRGYNLRNISVERPRPITELYSRQLIPGTYRFDEQFSY